MARFEYYQRLSRRDKRIYDASDALGNLPLPGADQLVGEAVDLSRALARGERAGTEVAARRMVRAILERLQAPPVRVKVMAVRPSANWGELQGLYEPGEGRAWPLITVWMRTARQKKPVAFRTFLRTLLHEVMHHLDYELLDLEDSFHTHGFYRREASLFRQLAAHWPIELTRTAKKKATGKNADEPVLATARGTKKRQLPLRF